MPLMFYLLVGLGLVLAAAALLLRHPARGERKGIETTGDRLLAHSLDRCDYRLFVGVPPADPEGWGEVDRIDGPRIFLRDQTVLKLNEVTAYFVAYPGGQLVDCRNIDHLPLPRWVRFPERSCSPDQDILTLDDLKAGKAHASVSFGQSTSRPGSRHHYSTTVTNISGERIRVRRFGAFKPAGDGFRLSTITSRFFSAEDFREWYTQKTEWLEPGASVTDPNNYGFPPVLWAYHCENEEGEVFIAGGMVE
ncbi:MAG: hypothetical protein KA419_20515 [Acidobacteria bacterium]|nr:hypothetical protein [Acidobacteriota bacterium]